MKSVSDAHPESVNARLADYLRSHKEAILSDWGDREMALDATKEFLSLGPVSG